MIFPEHMTVWDRNQRLYETLKGMGLFTEVVLCRDDPTKIDQIIVAVASPTVELYTAKSSPSASIFPPVESSEVVEGFPSSSGDGNNVIDFPPVL